MNRSDGAVDWLSWSPEAFAQAKAGQVPVLLSIGASWCRWSAEMTRTTYRDPVVCDLIEQRFVPIWVDADRRPDINERYNLGGWPTTTFLGSDGQVLGGETYVSPERMQMLLGRVAEAYRTHLEEADGFQPASVPRSAATHEPTDNRESSDLVLSLEQHLLDQFDAKHGGFGTDSKRVHMAALQFGLRRVASGHRALRELVERTLDAIGWGGLYDDVDGGVFRYCSGRDWTAPHVEKLIGVNAGVLELLVEGWTVLGEPRYRERAIDLLGYIRHTLVDPEGGGFYASQFADDDYYDASPAERAQRSSPSVDRSVYTDSTARMAAAFLRAGEVLEDTSLLECGVTSLERVVGDTYQRGHGIAHAADDAEITRGWLRDQVSASEALLDAYLATDREVYLDMSEELMRFAIRELWDSVAGGFRDRAVREDDVGLLREPLQPFGSNCAAARVLARLGELTEHDDFRERAAATLASQLSVARGRGVEAAPWALAALELRM